MSNRTVCKSQSHYDFYIDRQHTPFVLVVRDLDVPSSNCAPRTDGAYMSVTNNLEAVLDEITQATVEDLTPMAIIYRDSDLHYDGVMRVGGSLVIFNLVRGAHTNNEDEALYAVRDYYRRCAGYLITKSGGKMSSS
jgi:hypothetical protein